MLNASRFLVLPFIGIVACTGTSTPSTAPAPSASVSAEGEAGGNGEIDDSTSPEAGAETKAPLSGDVWVDAKDKVIGLARMIDAGGDDPTQALIDADGLAWSINADEGYIGPIVHGGAFYYEGPSCTGNEWLGPGVGTFYGVPLPGVTNQDYGDIFAVKASATAKPLPAFASQKQGSVVCRAEPVTLEGKKGFTSADIVYPKRPTGFVAPFRIERR